jgi:hypothetical protein
MQEIGKAAYDALKQHRKFHVWFKQWKKRFLIDLKMRTAAPQRKFKN